jgi:hypothetical protein
LATKFRFPPQRLPRIQGPANRRGQSSAACHLSAPSASWITKRLMDTRAETVGLAPEKGLGGVR